MTRVGGDEKRDGKNRQGGRCKCASTILPIPVSSQTAIVKLQTVTAIVPTLSTATPALRLHSASTACMHTPYISQSLPTIMDDPVPAETPFDAISVQSNKLLRVRIFNAVKSRRRTDNLLDLPGLPRQINSLCHLPMGWHRRPLRPLLPPNRYSQRLVHHSLLSRHLPPKSLPCLPTTEVRPITHSRRRTGRWRIITTHKTRPGIQTLHPKIA